MALGSGRWSWPGAAGGRGCAGARLPIGQPCHLLWQPPLGGLAVIFMRCQCLWAPSEGSHTHTNQCQLPTRGWPGVARQAGHLTEQGAAPGSQGRAGQGGPGTEGSQPGRCVPPATAGVTVQVAEPGTDWTVCTCNLAGSFCGGDWIARHHGPARRTH